MANIIFNEKSLSRIFYDIYLVTGVRVSIFEPPLRYDLSDSAMHFFNCVAYPPDMPFGFCRTIRKCKKIDETCFNCDNNAISIVEKTKKTYIYTCHMGLKEALLPVIINGNVVAMLFVGQVKTSETDPDFNSVCDNIIKLVPDFFDDVKREVLESEFSSLNILSEDAFSALCRLIERFLPEFIDNGLISTSKSNLASQLVYYVRKNIDKHIKLSDVTEDLNVSQAHLCRLVKQEFEMSFTEYVNDVKIKRAIKLLTETEYSVMEIAQGLGFEDPNYFSRLFKKMTGENARTYRENVQKNGINTK